MEKKKNSHSTLVKNSGLGVLIAFSFSFSILKGQQSLETNYRMTGEAITGMFEPQREAIQKFSAVIYDGRDEIVYGVVISEDGYLLTKASEIEGVSGLNVRVDRQSFKKAEVVIVDPRWDVALLKVDAKGLIPADYAASSDLTQGTWVIVNGATSRTKRRIQVGVISANAREIPPSGGAVLGVQLKGDDGKLVIEDVSEGSGAEKAGMEKGDLIINVEGTKVGDIEELMKELEGKKAGTAVKISVKRGDEVLELDVTLSARDELFQQMDRNDMMSGDFSERRSGFPRIIQHDILGNSDTMGGPVLDFDGRVIGMNIARANRAETFAIPVEELKVLADGMLAQVPK